MNGMSGPLLTFVGAATLDALALVPVYPEPDERMVATELEYAGGGPAATAAVAAARLGHRTAFAGAVGDDDEGQRIVAGLQSEGVDTTATVTVPGARSGASVVVVASSTATRAISNRPLPLVDLGRREVAELLAASDWVHVDHIGWPPTMDVLSSLPRRPRLSYDGGHLTTGFHASGLDLYVPTVEALRRRFGTVEDPEDVDGWLHLAQAESGGAVVATDGARGSYVLDRDGTAQHVPSFAVDVVSTLGAGDVFHGALLAGLASGYPLIEAVRRANAVAALSCRALDGRSAVPDTPALDAFLASRQSAPTAVSVR